MTDLEFDKALLALTAQLKQKFPGVEMAAKTSPHGGRFAYQSGFISLDGERRVDVWANPGDKGISFGPANDPAPSKDFSALQGALTQAT